MKEKHSYSIGEGEVYYSTDGEVYVQTQPPFCTLLAWSPAEKDPLKLDILALLYPLNRNQR